MVVKRFYFVRSPRSTLVHMSDRVKVEGERTVCGLRMQAGWLWTVGPLRDKTLTRCARCDRGK